MRSIKNMFVARLKGSLKEPFSIIFIVVAILISIIPVIFDNNYNTEKIPVGIVCENKGDAYYSFISMLIHYEEFEIHEWSYDKAIRNLLYDRLDAVYVLSDDFEYKVEKGEYNNLMDAYSSISSPHLDTISEAIIDTTMTISFGNLSVIKSGEFLEKESVIFTSEDELELHEKISDVVDDIDLIGVTPHIPKKARLYSQTNIPLINCTTWYCAFSVFFIIAGAGWIIDLTNKATSQRLKQMQIGRTKALIGASLVPIFLSLAGWIVSVVICALITDVQIIVLLQMILPTLLYFIGIMSMTLIISLIVSRTINLILIAPMITLLHAVISGMLVKLPDWAMRLEFISQILPGRMYVTAINDISLGNSMISFNSIIITLVWCIISFFISSYIHLRQNNMSE